MPCPLQCQGAFHSIRLRLVLRHESLLSEAGHGRIVLEVGASALKVCNDRANSARIGYDVCKKIGSLGAKDIRKRHGKQDETLLGEGDIDFVCI